MSGLTLDMRALGDAIRGAGFPVRIESTGGGCATMYVGVCVNPDTVGDSLRFPVVLGPGVFDRDGAWADWEDFWIGPDNDGDDAITTDSSWSIDRAVDVVRENFARWEIATGDFSVAWEEEYSKGEIPGYWIEGGK